MEELEVLLLGAEHGAKRNEDVMRVASIIEVPELTTGLSDIRHAIKQQYKAEVDYLDAQGNSSSRVIWPVLIGLFQQHYVLVAWWQNYIGERSYLIGIIWALRNL